MVIAFLYSSMYEQRINILMSVDEELVLDRLTLDGLTEFLNPFRALQIEEQFGPPRPEWDFDAQIIVA